MHSVNCVDRVLLRNTRDSRPRQADATLTRKPPEIGVMRRHRVEETVSPAADEVPGVRERDKEEA